MDGALGRAHEAGADLDALRAECEGSSDTPTVRDAAGGDDGDVDGVRELRGEDERSEVADVPARLHTLPDHRVSADRLHTLGEGHGWHDGQDLDASFLERVHVPGRVAGAGGNHRYGLIEHQLYELVDVRREQHEIDAERLVGERLGSTDLLAEEIGRHVSGPDDADAAGVADCGGELGGRGPGHTALNDRVLDAQERGESRA